MPDAASPHTLSETEIAILRLLATGATNREIARERGISEATVKKHVTNINAKLGTGNRTEAVRRGFELGIVALPSPEDGAETVDRAAAHRLAQELERTRRRTRRIVRAFVALGAVALLMTMLGTAAVLYYVDDWAQATPTPRPVMDGGPRWQGLPNLPTARSGLALAAVGDALYAVGGADHSGLITQTLRFDTRALTWTPAAPKPTPVRDVTAAVIGDAIFVPGGCDSDGNPQPAVEVYDVALDRWRTVAPLPEAVCGYGLAAVERSLYVFGGRSGEQAETASEHVWRYDAATDAWEAQADMPLPRCDLAAVTIGREVHVLGGRDRAGHLQPNHWVFAPAEAGAPWHEADPRLPEGRAGLAAASLLNWAYVVGGGWDVKVDRGALRWNASLGGPWDTLAEPRAPTPRRGHALTVDNDGVLYVAGGESDGRLLDQFASLRVLHTVFVPPSR